MALNQEQEMIAQAIAGGGNPHAASIHSSNYRTAAQNYNKQRNQDLDTRIQTLRTELQTSIVTACANVTNQKTVELKQMEVLLRAEMTKLGADLSVKHSTLVNECSASRNRCEELSGDVKFARHELKSIGDKFTTLNHYVTNKNKDIILVIESLQKEVQLLKSPPPAASYSGPVVVALFLLVLAGLAWLLGQPRYLMLEY